MATIVTRSGKGSELSFAEVDGNFTGLASDTATLFGRVYTPVATTAAIPASPADGDRIEIINSTGIRSLLNVQNIPADFPNSGDISGLQVRLQYSSSLSAWQWVSYEAKAPDARYVLQSNISSSTSSTSTTTVANSAAVKAAKDAADAAQASADLKAPTLNAVLQGTPTAPTAPVDTGTTQLASTAFVLGQASQVAPPMDGAAAAGGSPRFARADHVHPTDTSRAPVASPTFTGTVTIPAGASISGFAPLASPVFTGTVTIPAGASISGFAPLASPVFTGIPEAPTAAAGTNTTQLATTAFVATAASASVPAGTIITFAGNTAPTGWLKANGVIVPNGSGTVQGITANFAALYAVLGTTYGAAGQLPDLRGEFIRGWDDGRGIDSGRVFGSFQADAFKAHSHTYTIYGGLKTLTGGGNNTNNWYEFSTASTSSEGGTETRPRNIALLYCIKY